VQGSKSSHDKVGSLYNWLVPGLEVAWPGFQGGGSQGQERSEGLHSAVTQMRKLGFSIISLAATGRQETTYEHSHIFAIVSLQLVSEKCLMILLRKCEQTSSQSVQQFTNQYRIALPLPAFGCFHIRVGNVESHYGRRSRSGRSAASTCEVCCRCSGCSSCYLVLLPHVGVHGIARLASRCYSF
jgi:hypothetical protein